MLNFIELLQVWLLLLLSQVYSGIQGNQADEELEKRVREKVENSIKSLAGDIYYCPNRLSGTIIASLYLLYLSAEWRCRRVCHAGAFLHLCYIPVGGVSMTFFLPVSNTYQLTTDHFLFLNFICLSDEIGLSLSIPIISAGSFGLSCDYKPKLTRILPPARKISDLFVIFMKEKLKFKDPWNKVYVYKKSNNVSEDCFWWDKTVCRSPLLSKQLNLAPQHEPFCSCIIATGTTMHWRHLAQPLQQA